MAGTLYILIGSNYKLQNNTIAINFGGFINNSISALIYTDQTRRIKKQRFLKFHELPFRIHYAELANLVPAIPDKISQKIRRAKFHTSHA